MSVDSKSYELAERFLSECLGATKADIQALAENIQQCCEDACNDVELRRSAQTRAANRIAVGES